MYKTRDYVIYTFRMMFKDAHTINYGHFQFKRTNITAVRLIDPSSATVTSMMKDLQFVQERMHLNMEAFRADTITVIKIIYTIYLVRSKLNELVKHFQVNALLMFDAVNMYAQTLRGLGGTKIIHAEPNSCANRSISGWSSGFGLINFMRVVSNFSDT